MPVDLDAALRDAVRDVLPDAPGIADDDLGRWRPDGAGRWSSPAALRLAGPAGMPVALLATRLAAGLSERLTTATDGSGVEVAEGGFLVVTPGPADLAAVVATVVGAGAAYGRPVRAVSRMTMEPAVPQRRTPDNPLFVVMWAHARCWVALDTREALEGARTVETRPATTTTTEPVLILLLADFPRALETAGDDPEAVLRRLHEIAAATHRWLDESADRDGWIATAGAAAPGRQALAEATRQVLWTGLDLLGLPAPDHL